VVIEVVVDFEVVIEEEEAFPVEVNLQPRRNFENMFRRN
jgi:hypothetical protein